MIQEQHRNRRVPQQLVSPCPLIGFNAADQSVDLTVQQIFQSLLFLFGDPAGETEQQLITEFRRLLHRILNQIGEIRILDSAADHADRLRFSIAKSPRGK